MIMVDIFPFISLRHSIIWRNGVLWHAISVSLRHMRLHLHASACAFMWTALIAEKKEAIYNSDFETSSSCFRYCNIFYFHMCGVITWLAMFFNFNDVATANSKTPLRILSLKISSVFEFCNRNCFTGTMV